MKKRSNQGKVWGICPYAGKYYISCSETLEYLYKDLSTGRSLYTDGLYDTEKEALRVIGRYNVIPNLKVVKKPQKAKAPANPLYISRDKMRKITDKVVDSSFNQKLENIFKIIRKAADEGKYSVIVSDSLLTDIYDCLVNKHKYSISDNIPYQEVCTIYWM